jgi:branched-chain amino acid transport system ATP-binding protein
VRLEVTDLNAYYGSSHVLHDVSLRVEPGEAVALLGRNGAGKSTTLHSIMGILRSTTGSIRVGDQEIRARPPHVIAQKGLGFIPETRRVFPDLSVMENLEVGVKQGVGDRQWTVEEMFQLFPLLAELRERKGGALSGGEQQMLSIARTLVGNPDILLLDERSEGLAPAVVDLLEDQLLRLRETGVSMLLCEQHLPFAISVTDRAYVIERGTIRFEGQSGQVARHDVRDKYLAI